MPKNKKSPPNNQSKAPIYLTIIAAILIPLIGIFIGPCVAEKWRMFVNKPQLSGKIQKVVLTEQDRHSWKMSIFSRITNSGNSGTSLDFRNVEVIIPEYSSSNLVLPISEKKPLKINARESIYDTTSVVLELYFKLEKKNNLPNWEEIKLTMREPRGIFVIGVNSSDGNETMYNMVQMKSYYDSLDKLCGYPLLREWDEVGDYLLQHRIAVGKSYVEFKGKKYLNYLSPPQVEIEYEIKRDSIYVKSKNFKEEYNLYPSPEIRDITVFPKVKIKFTTGMEKNDKIYFRDIDLIFKGKREITHFFE